MASNQRWEDSAPANIALIKYMGKNPNEVNKPINSSLSYTLDNLRSYVILELNNGKQDEWRPWPNKERPCMALNEKSIKKYLDHLQFLKNYWGVKANFTVYSANEFPADCGLASSASSFAALTKTAAKALNELAEGRRVVTDIAEMANLSRHGSGSSIRSFYSPWSMWNSEGLIPVNLPYKDLIHMVVVVSKDPKKVSSSEAHRRIGTSTMMDGRPQRANSRLEKLVSALYRESWEEAYQIVWAEFWDMHVLFETSQPPFYYIIPQSLEVIRSMQNLWEKENSGPLVTLDAGANVHLLFRRSQKELADRIEKDMSKKFTVFSSEKKVLVGV